MYKRQGTYRDSVTNPYFIRFSNDGGTTWLGGERFRMDGINGINGINGTNGQNAPNLRIQYSIDGTTYHDSVANPYFIRFSVDNGVTWLAGERFREVATNGRDGNNGLPGQSNIIIYRSSATVPANPGTGTLVTAADPSTYTPPASWSLIVPARTTTADIYQAYVTLARTGTTPTVTRALFLEPRLIAPVIPTSSMNYPNGIQYGIANGQTPAGTANNTQAFNLAVGASHTTESITFPDTTTTADNIYITLPAGLSLTSALDSVEGEEITYWIQVGSTQTYVFTIGFEDAEVTYVFVVRRDS